MSKGCHFCTLLVEVGVQYEDDDEGYHRAVDALFDQAARAQRLHRNYGARRRMLRFR